MDQSVKSFAIHPLEYLTYDQMRRIHSGALEILEDVGTKVHNLTAVELLYQAGALVKDDQLVFIPPALAEWALRQAPSRALVYDRDGRPAMHLENRNAYFGTGSDVPYLIDFETGERREFMSVDSVQSIRLVDALPYIDFTMSNGLAPDLPADTQYQEKFAIMVRNTVKPQVITAADRSVLEKIIYIAAAVRGGVDELKRKPLFVLYDEPTSPLVHTNEALDKLMLMAEMRLPTNYSPGMMAGATGPVTMSGAVTLAAAETIAGLVIHQLKNPGAPFVFGAGMSPFDMKSSQPTYSAPEAMMTQSGLCQLARSLYNLPTWGFAGCSASKTCDEQAVMEATSFIMMAGLAGTNLVHDVGYLEFGLTYSYELLAMCDEFIGQLRRFMGGINVDSEHMALDVVRRVGPGGQFLTDMHTFEHFKEDWQPDLVDRSARQTWEKKGRLSMGDRARAKVRHILDNHQVPPLADAVNEEIDRILKG